MTIYSGFSHEKLWFSIAMLVYQRVIICHSISGWWFQPKKNMDNFKQIFETTNQICHSISISQSFISMDHLYIYIIYIYIYIYIHIYIHIYIYIYPIDIPFRNLHPSTHFLTGELIDGVTAVHPRIGVATMIRIVRCGHGSPRTAAACATNHGYIINYSWDLSWIRSGLLK